MSKKLLVDHTDRKDDQLDIVFRLADVIDVSDKDALYQTAEDLIMQHAHKEYPNRTIRVTSLSVGSDRRGHASVRAYAE